MFSSLFANVSSKFLFWFLAGTTITAGLVGYYVVVPQLAKATDKGYGSTICSAGKIRQDKKCVCDPNIKNDDKKDDKDKCKDE